MIKRPTAYHWNKVPDGTVEVCLRSEVIDYCDIMEDQLTAANAKRIYGFYEDEFPIYSTIEDGLCELHFEVEPKELNGLVDTIKTERAKVEKLRGAMQSVVDRAKTPGHGWIGYSKLEQALADTKPK